MSVAPIAPVNLPEIKSSGFSPAIPDSVSSDHPDKETYLAEPGVVSAPSVDSWEEDLSSKLVTLHCLRGRNLAKLRRWYEPPESWESKHRWDPKATWTPTEQRKLLRKLGERLRVGCVIKHLMTRRSSSDRSRLPLLCRPSTGQRQRECGEAHLA